MGIHISLPKLYRDQGSLPAKYVAGNYAGIV